MLEAVALVAIIMLFFYVVKLERERAELARRCEEKIAEARRDAVSKSSVVRLGRVGEQLAPLLVDVSEDLRDYRFLGSPVDFIVFKGLYRGEPEEIIFLEVKTGKTTRLSERERMVKRLVEECRVRFQTINVRDKLSNS
ncbi:MAG: Holliday junction resolvase [Candidatus Diapherotrites archaeon]|nr:Holliday junction resolvase [Candidatus Diapherotrites archaeon]